MGRLGAVARTAIARSAPLRAIVKSPPAQRLIQTWRGARVVRGSVRFVLLELASRRAASYELGWCRRRVYLRHGTRDIAILNEIFGGTGGSCAYEPPGELAPRLGPGSSPRVLDVGANIGLFGIHVLCRWPNAEVTSYEPDPANARLLARAIAANDSKGRWRLVPAAASNTAGTMMFAAGLFSDAHAARPGDADAILVPCVDLF